MPKSDFQANQFLVPNDQIALNAEQEALLKRLKMIRTRNKWMRSLRLQAERLRRIFVAFCPRRRQLAEVNETKTVVRFSKRKTH
jgi:hypothetical protein